jgi:amino-acid N-acetyltransferase
MEITVRRARTSDVRHIRRLIDTYTADRRLLSKATVALFEDVQEFWVADADGSGTPTVFVADAWSPAVVR